MKDEPIHLNVSTDQEAFDVVFKHLTTMKQRAISDLGECMYRTPDNRRCAIGALIDDGDYSSVFDTEGGSVRTMVASGFLNLDGLNIDLLRELQQVHDNSFSWDTDDEADYGKRRWGVVLGAEGHEQLRRIATKYGLTVPEAVSP